VAGPIVRANEFIPQLHKKYFLSRRQFGIAVFWIMNGLVKKIVLSDYIAVNFIDRVFDRPLLYTGFENLMALFGYSLQVYADFSGYTDIAIGVAMLMGFYLPVNFNSPYKAQNPTDFWRRWHMSLSRWLRDYLYIPLGGNRTAGVTSYAVLSVILLIAAFRLKNIWFTLVVCTVIAVVLLLRFLPAAKGHRKTLGTNVNNMDTMLLGGLWHGSSFNFITWGGLNGLGILVHKWWRNRSWHTRFAALAAVTLALTITRHLTDSPLLNLLAFCCQVLLVGFAVVYGLQRFGKYPNFNLKLSTGWSVLITFVFISFTRLFFRSGSNLDPAEANETAWRTASQMVDRIGSHWNLSPIPDILSNYSPVFLLFAAGMLVHWLPTRFKRRYRLWFASMPLWLMCLLCIALAVTLYQFVTADLQPFIYFQF
jgi:D-alanyl-lipoteichoic acid acyltransferase DltB (MBOAT superfamily)